MVDNNFQTAGDMHERTPTFMPQLAFFSITFFVIFIALERTLQLYRHCSTSSCHQRLFFSPTADYHSNTI
jgi:hypothetical protein